MAYAPALVAALGTPFGSIRSVHTALPPFHLGGAGVDVAEVACPNGMIAYVTAGLSDPNVKVMSPLGWRRAELVMFAAEPDARLARLMSTLGAATRTRKLAPHDTLPLAGPDAAHLFAALLFLFDEASCRVANQEVAFVRVVGITGDERAYAMQHGSRSLIAALAVAKRVVASVPGRASVATIATAPPDLAAAARSLEGAAQFVALAAITADGQSAEGLRDRVTEKDIEPVVAMLGTALPHPAQLSTLLHAFCDHRHDGLARVGRRLIGLVLEGAAERDAMRLDYLANAISAVKAASGVDFETIGAADERIREDEAFARLECAQVLR